MKAYSICIGKEKKLAFIALILSLFLTEYASGQLDNDLTNSGMERFLEYSSIISSDYFKDSTYVFEDESGSWILKSKSCFNYNVQGNETLQFQSSFSEGVWTEKLKIEKAYDTSQNLIYERTSKWNDKHDTWGFSEKRDIFYNSIDLIEREITHSRADNIWEKDAKFEYSYFQSYHIQSISEFTWKAEADQWQPIERILFEYTESDFIDREIIQIWDDSLSTWLNATSKDYTYDEYDQLISSTRSSWSISDQIWVDISMISLIYNDKGQIQRTRQIELSPSSAQTLVSQDVSYDDDGNLGETIISNWNENDGEWDSVTKKVHFWSENMTGNLGSKTDHIACAFMNPYILGLSWKCSSLKENVLYSVEVFDLWGRRFFAKQFLGNRAFRISGNIPPGVYTVVIRGGLDVHTEKVIIKG